MSFAKTLSRKEMKNIMAGGGPKEISNGGGGGFTDEYGCTYSSSRAGCQSYYDCLTGVCTSTVLEDGWDAAGCVEEVQTLRLAC